MPCRQAWSRFIDVEINGNEAFTVKAPPRGHRRRDVPTSVTASLKRGVNHFEVHAEDDRLEDMAFAVVILGLDSLFVSSVPAH